MGDRDVEHTGAQFHEASPAGSKEESEALLSAANHGATTTTTNSDSSSDFFGGHFAPSSVVSRNLQQSTSATSSTHPPRTSSSYPLAGSILGLGIPQGFFGSIFALTPVPFCVLLLLLLLSLVGVYSLHGDGINSILTPGQRVDGRFQAARDFDPLSKGISSREAESAQGHQCQNEALAAANAAYEENLLARVKVINGKFPERPYRGWSRRRVAGVFLVPLFPCPLERRMGTWGDGGKWVCHLDGLLGSSSVVYSVGSNNVTDFEEAIFTTYKTKPFTFDPSLDEKRKASVNARPFMHFFDIGFGRPLPKHPSWVMKEVRAVMKSLKHSYVDVFKIDCEGCERDVMPEVLNQFGRNNAPFGQVLMEIHDLDSVPRTLDLLLAMEDLGYRLFHVEDNPAFSRGMELAYIHESLVDPKLRH